MPVPDPQTLAARSEVAPTCASRAALGVLLLLAACLNPMPEEFPSGGDRGAVAVDGPSGGLAGEAPAPAVPDSTSGPSYNVDNGGGGGGPGQMSAPPAADPSAPDEGGGELAAPDAGADAGTLRAEGTEPETDSGEAGE